MDNRSTTAFLPGPVINPVVENSDEPQPSLSDLHDFEPKLEFDDTELLNPTALNSGGVDLEEILNPLEDDFEDLLGEEQTEVLSSCTNNRKRKCDFLGTDKQGRHIFAIYASRFPEKAHLHKFIQEIIKDIEPYVENDYILVYFHRGLKADTNPSPQFLWQSYKELNRNFRKNLKTLYVVHPTWFIRVVWNFFSRFISEKFRKKLVYISGLDELRQALGLSKLKIPDNICDIDDILNKKTPYAPSASLLDHTSSRLMPSTNAIPSSTLKTAQFGVSLTFIVSNSPCLNSIPPIVRKCVDSLSIAGMIDTEGIFRRSGNHSEIMALKDRVNRGEDVNLKDVNVHVIAGLLKSFFRDLAEPLLTFDVYDDVKKFLDYRKEDRSRFATQIIRERLPEDNYELFKYVIEFLVRVMECEDLNKMTSSNLSIVFGPNFLWSNTSNTLLEDIAPINAFVDFVLQNHRDIYLVDINHKDL